MVPRRSVHGKAVGEIVERLPEALDLDHMFADRGWRTRYVLQVTSGREVVRVRMGIQDPVDRGASPPDIIQNGIRRSSRRRAGLLVEVQHWIDNRAALRGGIRYDVLYAVGARVEEPPDLGADQQGNHFRSLRHLTERLGEYIACPRYGLGGVVTSDRVCRHC